MLGTVKKNFIAEFSRLCGGVVIVIDSAMAHGIAWIMTWISGEERTTKSAWG
jgi:hypothetical protein